jgi:hypothetical protein
MMHRPENRTVEASKQLVRASLVWWQGTLGKRAYVQYGIYQVIVILSCNQFRRTSKIASDTVVF